MEDDKEWEEAKTAGTEEGSTPSSEKAARARNKTVMLSPDIAGQVRARFAQEQGEVQTFGDTGESKVSQVFHQGLVPTKPHSTQAFEDDWESVAGKVISGAGSWESESAPAPMPASTEDQRMTPAGESQQSPRNPTQHIIGRETLGQTSQASSAGHRSSLGATTNSPSPTSSLPAAGRDVKPEKTQVVPTGATAIWTGELGPVIGFLVSYDEVETGEVCILRVGRMIVSSSMNGDGNILFVPNKTVSAMHAILRMNKVGDIQILDQLSEHGTKIQRGDTGEVSEISGEKAALFHGDTIHFGERRFYVCVVFRPMEGE